MRVTWVGHATVVLDIGGVRVLTDPLLRRHAGPLRRVGPPPDPATWAEPDLVLVSHLHADHASVGSLRMLAGVPMLSAARNERWLAARVGARVVGAADHDWVRVSRAGVGPAPGRAGAPEGGVTVRLVRADHRARPMPHRPRDAHGHLLRSAEGSVWFAGDTSLYDDMAGLPDLAGGAIDLALLPIGGWGPRLSAGHMGPEEAGRGLSAGAAACRAADPLRHVPRPRHGTGRPRLDDPARTPVQGAAGRRVPRRTAAGPVAGRLRGALRRGGRDSAQGRRPHQKPDPWLRMLWDCASMTR